MFFSVVAEMLVAERVVDDARRERSGTNLKKVAILTWKEQMLCACSIYYYYSKNIYQHLHHMSFLRDSTIF